MFLITSNEKLINFNIIISLDFLHRTNMYFFQYLKVWHKNIII